MSVVTKSTSEQAGQDDLIRWELHSVPPAPSLFHLGCKLPKHNCLASLIERGPDSFDLFLTAKVAGSALLLKGKSKAWIEGYLSKIGLPSLPLD